MAQPFPAEQDRKPFGRTPQRLTPVLPMGIGKPERQTHDCIRHGTTSLFASLEVASGKVLGQCHGRHRHQEFLKFLKLVDASHPEREGETLHLTMDNYATHNTPHIRKWWAKHPRFHFHFTSAGASWLNQIERFFGLLTDQRIFDKISRDFS